MTSQYVLPSLIPDEDEMDAGKMLAQLRKRASSTSSSQVHDYGSMPILRNNFSVVPSMRVSSRSSRSGSYSSRPPSSFRIFTAGSDTTSNSSHAFPSPSIRKRTSSLALDGKARANAANHKVLPSTPLSARPISSSTPMSATPSLTFSHSRTASRSDEDAFSSSSSRYSPINHRHAIIDYNQSLDVLDQFEEQYAQLQSENNHGSIHKNKPHQEDSFLPVIDDEVVADMPLKTKKKTVAFKSGCQRHSDKVAQMLGEDYREVNKRAVQGQLHSQSTISLISPSKAGFRALFSTMKGKIKKDENDIYDPFESSWEKERRLEEKQEKQERKKQETQAKVLEMVTEFSTVRTNYPRKLGRDKVNRSAVVVDKGKAREVRSSELTRPKPQHSVFFDEPVQRPLQTNSSDKVASSSSQPGRRRRGSTASITDGSFLSLTRGISDDSITRKSSDISSHPAEGAGQVSSPAASRPIKKSHSIDALYEMLQPCVEQQQEREERKSKANKSSPLIEWPQARRENPLSLTEIKRKMQEQQAPNTERQSASKAAPLVDADVDLLPPLTSHLEQCLAQTCMETMHPWKGERERSRVLTASSPRDAVPKGWTAYIRAYAKGDFELSNPPPPRSAPLVRKAVPRSSPMIGSSSPLMPPMLGSSWSTSPGGLRTRLASKDSLQSLNIFYDMSSSSLNLSNNMQPTTPPHHQSLRDRLPSPRFAIRKSRSREASQEKMRLPREDDEEVRLQAEELAAVGGMGDIKGPRPTWEVERSACARGYLQDHYYQTSPQLQAIVERLAHRVNVSYSSVQILVGEESIVLASSGLDEEARAAFSASPQMDCIAQGGSDQVKIELRDDTLDAHAILQRDGAPLLIADLTNDWRFEDRKGVALPFYAGVSLFGSGLPIGTISVKHHRAKEMTREEKDALVETAREVERELQQMQSDLLKRKLQQLDHDILGWVAAIQNQKSIARPPSLDFAAIDTSLNLSLNISSPVPQFEPSSESVLSNRLSSALQTILNSLQVEFAYIARVGSDPLQCRMEVQQESGVFRAKGMRLDAALHLCALAAHKHGLHFDNDKLSVGQLMGEQIAKEDEAAGIPHFTSARVVGCGLKEGGRAYRGTEGWVLGVASRSNGHFDAASGVYLMKFATLLAPLLLQGPPSPQWRRRRNDSMSSPSNGKLQEMTSEYRSSPLPYINKKLPNAPSINRKRMPLASPPPGAPPPPPPMMAATTAPGRSHRSRT